MEVEGGHFVGCSVAIEGRPAGGQAVAVMLVSIVSAANNVLLAAVGLEPADASAELPGQVLAVDRRRVGDQCAWQRDSRSREVRLGTRSDW